MNHDIYVLRALARLSRRSLREEPADGESLALRAGGTVEEVRGAVARLERAGLAQRTERGVRLTMIGLAVAVASGAPVSRRAHVSRVKDARGRRAA
jgi:hypothetical protein